MTYIFQTLLIGYMCHILFSFSYNYLRFIAIDISIAILLFKNEKAKQPLNLSRIIARVAN